MFCSVPYVMLVLLGHSSLPAVAELPLTHGAKTVTRCLAGKYVKYAMVIFIHGGYVSPFVSEFLHGDGLMIPFGQVVSFFVY